MNHTSYGFVFPRRALLGDQMSVTKRDTQLRHSIKDTKVFNPANFRNPITRVGATTNKLHYMRLPASKRYVKLPEKINKRCPFEEELQRYYEERNYKPPEVKGMINLNLPRKSISSENQTPTSENFITRQKGAENGEKPANKTAGVLNSSRNIQKSGRTQPSARMKTVGLREKSSTLVSKAYSNYQRDSLGNSFQAQVKNKKQLVFTTCGSSTYIGENLQQPIQGISKFKQAPKPLHPVELKRNSEPDSLLTRQMSQPLGRNTLLPQNSTKESKFKERDSSEEKIGDQNMQKGEGRNPFEPESKRPFSSNCNSRSASQKTFSKAGFASRATLSRPATSNKLKYAPSKGKSSDIWNGTQKVKTVHPEVASLFGKLRCASTIFQNNQDTEVRNGNQSAIPCLSPLGQPHFDQKAAQQAEQARLAYIKSRTIEPVQSDAGQKPLSHQSRSNLLNNQGITERQSSAATPKRDSQGNKILFSNGNVHYSLQGKMKSVSSKKNQQMGPRGYNYYYSTNFYKNFQNHCYDNFKKDRNSPLLLDTSPKLLTALKFVNKHYFSGQKWMSVRDMYEGQKNIWEKYEQNWKIFSDSTKEQLEDMPWPPDYALLFYHMAVQFQIQKSSSHELNVKKELKKIHKEALLRYHPDRMPALFKHIPEEQQKKIDEQLNAISQVVNNDFSHAESLR